MNIRGDGRDRGQACHHGWQGWGAGQPPRFSQTSGDLDLWLVEKLDPGGVGPCMCTILCTLQPRHATCYAHHMLCTLHARQARWREWPFIIISIFVQREAIVE